MRSINKKGATLGGIIMIFIVIIVGVALFVATADEASDMTNIRTTVNQTVTTAAINASTTLTGRENTTAITVVNYTGGQDWTGNFTVTTRNTGGALAILLTTTDAAGLNQSAQQVNVSYSYKPQGYNDSSGARSIVNVILIFAALALAISVIPGFKEWLDN